MNYLEILESYIREDSIKIGSKLFMEDERMSGECSKILENHGYKFTLRPNHNRFHPFVITIITCGPNTPSPILSLA